MKFFVISDTHGNIDKVKQVYQRLTGIDYLIHLGDFQSDALKLEKDLGVKVISVRGNTDGSHSANDYKILESEFGNILLVHGHMEKVKSSYQNLLYRAQELNCKAVLFGHTHDPFYGEFNGIYLLNPGSLSLPKNTEKASYAIVNTKKDEFYASIVYYNAIMAADSLYGKSKVEGGYLKNMLNNSDRF
jgi:putative phosphoesterase